MEKKIEHKYRILFKIGESCFELESTDISWLEKKEKEYNNKIAHQKEKKIGEKHTEGDKNGIEDLPPEITLQEFYRKYVQRIKSRPSIAVFFVYYLQKIAKQDMIVTGDIANCFKEVSYPNYNKLNVTDILTSSKKRALVNYVNKIWSLTTTGEDFVLNIISGNRE